MNRLIAVADIGGTNARFAIAELDGRNVHSISEPVTLRTSHVPTFAEAWKAFLGKLGGKAPKALGMAFAGPMDGPKIKLTNNGWSIDAEELRLLGIEELRVVNDFGAVAHAIGSLGNEYFRQLCGPAGPLPHEGVLTVVGPGTGLGVAQIVCGTVVETEGGHAGFSPWDIVEEQIHRELRNRMGRVEIEHVVSGPGLANIHRALTGEEADDNILWQKVLEGGTSEAFDRWRAILGGFAGDLALVQGADAVVVAGGLGYRLRDRLANSGFEERFVAKGKFEDRMRAIPVRILDHPQPGLLGAAIAFARGLPPLSSGLAGRTSSPMGEQDKKPATDAEIEREIRQTRKFNPQDALAKMAGPGAMKGASPVSPVQQAELEIGAWLRTNVVDPNSALQLLLHRHAKGSPLLMENLDRPLAALCGLCRQILDSDYRLSELVREADVEWGRAVDERPHFDRPGNDPHPDDPYTIDSVRTALTDIIRKLSGTSCATR